MIVPVRCFSCGKVLGNKWTRFLKLLREGVVLTEDMKRRNLNQIGAAMDKLGLTRYCCRAIMMSTVDMTAKLFNYDYGEQFERKPQTYTTT